MTDKEKIKEQANIDISNLRMAQEQGVITEFGRGKLEALEGIVDFIDSLQAEPTSRTPADIESAMQEVGEKSMAFTEAHKGESSDEILAQMRGEEPVSKDLEEAAQNWWKKTRLKSDLSGMPVNAFKTGAQWKNEKFIEKACEFFEDHLCCYIEAQDFLIDLPRLNKDFRKYLEDEV